MPQKVKSKYFPSGYRPDGTRINNTEEDLKINPSHPEEYFKKYGGGKYEDIEKVKEYKNRQRNNFK